MRFNQLVFIVILFVAAVISAMATDSPYQSLLFSSSARASALAGCFVAIPDDASAVIYNPASISTDTSKRFSTTFLKHVLDINSGMVSYVKPFNEIGIFAGSISYTNYGSFTAANSDGIKTGDFGANDLVISGTYSNTLDTNLYYGVSLKFVYFNIEKAASTAFAVDAGLFYSLPKIRTNIGVSILNAGTQLSKFEGTSENLPLDIRIGISNRLRGLPLLVNFSFHHLADHTSSFFDKFKNFSLGGELYLGQYIQARLGYDNMIRYMASADSDHKLSGFSGGLGIKTHYFTFDYGLSLVGSSAILNRFTIGLDL
jgi:hypothetical protein